MSGDELAGAYERLADAITEVARLEGAEGVLTEWVVVTSHQRYDDDGDQLVQIGQWLPGGGDAVPYHRVMGLLDYALTLRRHDITQWGGAMSDAIYRYEIPVDDRWHPLQLSGRIVHVDCRNMHVIEVWAVHGDQPAETRSFRVYGTGHPLPSDVQHVGTAIAPGGQLVWHLVETA